MPFCLITDKLIYWLKYSEDFYVGKSFRKTWTDADATRSVFSSFFSLSWAFLFKHEGKLKFTTVGKSSTSCWNLCLSKYQVSQDSKFHSRYLFFTSRFTCIKFRYKCTWPTWVNSYSTLCCIVMFAVWKR